MIKKYKKTFYGFKIKVSNVVENDVAKKTV